MPYVYSVVLLKSALVHQERATARHQLLSHLGNDLRPDRDSNAGPTV